MFNSLKPQDFDDIFFNKLHVWTDIIVNKRWNSLYGRWIIQVNAINGIGQEYSNSDEWILNKIIYD